MVPKIGEFDMTGTMFSKVLATGKTAKRLRGANPMNGLDLIGTDD